MVSKLTTLFIALAVPCTAQDFEPDRRPEEGLSFAVTYDSGSHADSSYLALAPTLAYYYVEVTSSGVPGVASYSSGGYRWPYNAAHRSSTFSTSHWVRFGTWRSNQWDKYLGNMYYLGVPGHYGDWGFLRDGSTRKTMFCMSNSANGFYYVIDSVIRSDDAWLHHAATFDGTNLRYYVNGVLQGTSAFGGSRSTTTTPLAVGYWPNASGTSAATSEHLRGQIDAVVFVAGRVWSAAEIMSQFQSGRTGQGDNQP